MATAKFDIHAKTPASKKHLAHIMRLAAERAELSFWIQSGFIANGLINETDASTLERVDADLRAALARVKPHKPRGE